MISGLNSTGHEIGGTIGIAVFSTIAAGATGALGGAHAASGDLARVRGSRDPDYVSLAWSPSPSCRTLATSCPSSASTPPRCRFTEMAKQTTPATTPRRRRSDADRSVAAILAAALDALASDPDASMAEIARRAGVVRATIYVHFPTRESLLDAVMEHAVARGRSGDDAMPSRARRAERSARAGAPRHLAEARPVPQPARDQHRPALGEGAAPPPPPGDDAVRAADRTRPEDGVFRSDLPVTWHLAVIRAIVHTASAELQSRPNLRSRGRARHAHDRARRDGRANRSARPAEVENPA